MKIKKRLIAIISKEDIVQTIVCWDAMDDFKKGSNLFRHNASMFRSIQFKHGP